MGWTDIVGSKVGRIILDSSQPLLQLHRTSPRRAPSASPQNQDDGLEAETLGAPEAGPKGEFRGGPDTSSLSAFIYSFLSPSKSDENGRNTDSGACTSDRSSQEWEKSDDAYREAAQGTSTNEDGDPDWCVVSANELEQSILEDYLTSHFETRCSPALPTMSEESCLLTESFRSVLYPSLPTIVKGCAWVLLYSTARDGISLLTLYRKSALLPGPCLLVTGDTKGTVFGGLLLAPLKASRNKYQGSNQTFVFTNVSGQPKVFRPTGLNRYFFLCTNDALAIGGGGHFALHLDSDLLAGSSGACETFGSCCLADTEEFEVKDVELWGFAHTSRHFSRPRSFNETSDAGGVYRCVVGIQGEAEHRQLTGPLRHEMVYHSSFKEDSSVVEACGCPLLPLRTPIKGPAPVASPGQFDIIDEAINFFRANVLFRKFEVKSSADKLLIYLTLYINMALKRIETCKSEAEGIKVIINLGLEKFPIPGEPGFPLGGLFNTPATPQEADLFRNYLKQLREETSGRLMGRVYRPNGTPNKWWLAFAKRRFMNILLPF